MVQLKNKGIYWALIITFIALYVAVAFVSTLHAITFFQLANTLGLAILLGAAYEIGQATVLFSILMTHNKNKLLAWGMMFLLTALQVTANVYASFKFMDGSGSNDWTYWQRAILFAVQDQSAEMYKIIISWISGALLPLVALGMTALVAENIRLAQGGDEEEQENLTPEKIEEIIENEVTKRTKEKEEKANKEPSKKFNFKKDFWLGQNDRPTKIETLEGLENDEQIQYPLKEPKVQDETPKTDTRGINGEGSQRGIVIKKDSRKEKKNESKVVQGNIEPVNKIRGWHFKNEFVDDNHNVFHKGKFIENNPEKTPTSKKA